MQHKWIYTIYLFIIVFNIDRILFKNNPKKKKKIKKIKKVKL